jgi:membrane dipeptidase
MSTARLFGALTLALPLLFACAGPTLSPEPVQDRAASLARSAVLVDTHIDVPFRLYRKPEDVSVATPGGDFDYPRAVAGGLDALFMSIYIPADVDEAGQARPFADGLIDSVEALANDRPEQFAVATCTGDIAALKGTGKLAFAMGMENGGPIEGSLESLDHFAERGIRYVTLTHSRSNHIADSSYDLNERWSGLSPFGKRLIPAMNQRGVMIDVSHASDRAFRQVLDLSEVPVIASHSSLRHFTPGFQRNMDDAMVKALGDNGGVIQINFGSGFLTAAARKYSNAREQATLRFRASEGLANGDPRLLEFARAYRQDNPYPFADLDDVLNHIDRAVELAGIDHIGIGSDYDGVGDSLPTGLKDVSEYPNLIAGLLNRGYSETDITKILSGNLLRVWREVERYAARAGYPARCRQ